MKYYVDERKNDVGNRVSIAITFAIGLWLFSWIIGIKHLGLIEGIINNLVLVFVTEFSFEFHEKKLMVRSNGEFYELDGILKMVTYPFACICSLFGLKNQPIWAWLTACVYIYAMLFHNWQVFDSCAHLVLMYILYRNRKKNK